MMKKESMFVLDIFLALVAMMGIVLFFYVDEWLLRAGVAINVMTLLTLVFIKKQKLKKIILSLCAMGAIALIVLNESLR